MICPPGVRIIRLCLLDEVVRPSSIGDCLPYPSPRHTFCEPKLLIIVATAQKHILKKPADSFSVGKVSHIFKCTKILVQCTESQVISCTMYSNYVIMYSFFLYTFLILYTFHFLMKCTRISLDSCTMYRNINKNHVFFVHCTIFFRTFLRMYIICFIRNVQKLCTDIYVQCTRNEQKTLFFLYNVQEFG